MRVFSFLIAALLVRAAMAAPTERLRAEEQARLYFEIGFDYYRLGEYKAAIDAFEAGYVCQPLPLFLFNIAHSAVRANKSEIAIEYYEKYIALETVRGSPQLAEARTELDRLRQKAPYSAPSPDSQPNRQSRSIGGDVIAPARPPPWWKQPWVWGTAAGVVAVGLSVGLGVGLGYKPSAP
jgi:tetratricopeptide (TPR) repeat protein